jgi:DNA-binding NtrC family response regulator
VDLAAQIRSLHKKTEILVTSLSEPESEHPELSELSDEGVLSQAQFDKLIENVERALARPSHPRNGPVKVEDGDRNGKQHTSLSRISTLLQGTTLIGRSALMRQLFKTIDRIAPIDSNVLITGATGTGKELVARAIHERSTRRNGPFVDVNSSAIPETLFETEFFGHQRGTFTGAYDTRRGLFERASGGTLFLDEVDSLNLAAQAKLLRVLQERHLRRLGGRENISIDVRIIAATGTNLKAATAQGKFRPDLYFRLRVVPLHVPQLRDRPEDVELLLDHFLSSHAQRTGKPKRHFSPKAIDALTKYSWPGNVRELENVIEYALAMGGDEELGIDDLPTDIFGEEMGDLQDPVAGDDLLDVSLAEVERRHILSVFQRCGRHHIKTAAALRIDRRTLYRKLQQYNLDLQIKSA